MRNLIKTGMKLCDACSLLSGVASPYWCAKQETIETQGNTETEMMK